MKFEDVKQIFIMGASDDLIEISGDHKDEFSEGVVHVFGGFSIEGSYDTGDWKFKIINPEKIPTHWDVMIRGYNDEFVVITLPRDCPITFTQEKEEW